MKNKKNWFSILCYLGFAYGMFRYSGEPAIYFTGPFTILVGYLLYRAIKKEENL